MADDFGDRQRVLSGPASGAFAITANNTAFTHTTRAIYVGGAGDVVCTLVEGAEVTFKAVPVGTVLPVRAVKVNTSTATLMIGLY
jgi:hypothetical protein